MHIFLFLFARDILAQFSGWEICKRGSGPMPYRRLGWQGEPLMELGTGSWRETLS